jgi:hypothetical protein
MDLETGVRRTSTSRLQSTSLAALPTIIKAVSDASERIVFEHKAKLEHDIPYTQDGRVAVMALMRTEDRHLRRASIGDTIVARASANEYLARH